MQLEEQRIVAKRTIDVMLYRTATHTCKVCRLTKYDPSFLIAIGKKLDPEVEMWPPRYASDPTIRQVLAAIASLDDFRAFNNSSREICHAHVSILESAERVHGRCKSVSAIVNYELPGLCFTCVKEDRKQNNYCEHREPLPRERLQKQDPIA